MCKAIIGACRLKELFEYNAETGALTRKTNGRYVGSIARGYIRVRIDGCREYAHRIIWCMTYGDWPKYEIDHINGIRSDNRIINLRDIPATLNRANLQKAVSTNKLGVLGVRYIQRIGKYEARIRDNGKQFVIGYFVDSHAAQLAVSEARNERFQRANRCLQDLNADGPGWIRNQP